MTRGEKAERIVDLLGKADDRRDVGLRRLLEMDESELDRMLSELEQAGVVLQGKLKRWLLAQEDNKPTFDGSTESGDGAAAATSDEASARLQKGPASRRLNDWFCHLPGLISFYGKKKPAIPSATQSFLAKARFNFQYVALLSIVFNTLICVSAATLVKFYDGVMPRDNASILLDLAALAVGLLGIAGLLDIIRSRILVRITTQIDQELSTRIYNAAIKRPSIYLQINPKHLPINPLNDLDSVRDYLFCPGPVALFDLVCIPLYLAACFALNRNIGLITVAGALAVLSLIALTELLTRKAIRTVTQSAITRNALVEASWRNAEAIAAMGMMKQITKRWNRLNGNYVTCNRRVSRVASSFGSMSRIVRILLQWGIFAFGAYLVTNGEANAGVIIAGAILGARSIAPVDVAIANWPRFQECRNSWRRLQQFSKTMPNATDPMPLRPPTKTLVLQNASVVPPGEHRVVIDDANFAVKSGQAVGIIGPTGAGKSSLLRMIVGVWPLVRGVIRIDGAALDQWSSEDLGQYMGYLPQDVELLAGTVAENIARFENGINAEAVISAAEAAGVHDLILTLPSGYDTQVGEQGRALSAGYAQRIALARALYGDPFLVVLDEPNSHLDAEGDEALTKAIFGVRARGGIVVLAAHRPSAIAAVDLIGVVARGRIQQFGPKEEILTKVLHAPAPAMRPLKIVPDAG